MNMYGEQWEKCSRCGTTSNEVKEGKCVNEERCVKYAVRKSDREFELRLAEDRAAKRKGPR